MKMVSVTALLATTTSLLATCSASSLTPPVLPLIVRNPYLSTWLANARDVTWSKWPIFYTGQEVRSIRQLCIQLLIHSPDWLLGDS